jgi:glycosyltransferase involved in cell wall biosynthesis
LLAAADATHTHVERQPNAEAQLLFAELAADPQRAAAMGAAGRERVLAEFGWPAIAQQTVEVYSRVLASRA